ncbi:MULTISPECIES: (2,3-dihydroxybenzoyl)adenylate synthase [Microbacterium]|uniref:(2,3-dihydroxybenzoyl)adenylate synthase n=1 Tax=Microbacterium TaxID=33882 RepID=UPI001EF60F4C|nr:MULTISPECIES: AMP-binding protein [Microbacterium]MCG7415549.1 AMP-binding protein [Microbacterium aurum]MCT1479465.1 AMP-binding protein [Microbacterium sp. p3-SID336]MCT2225084.1 AMP-binding protein [Microbacterium paraoxydans]
MASTTTTEGVVPWPTDLAAQYREAGYWKDELLTAPIWRMAARRPDDIALVDGETRIGYAEMCRRADALGARLRELGFETDDRVVVQLPNTWEFVIFTLGCLRAGIIPVMALPAHRRHELEYLAEHSEAVAMVVPDILRDFDHQALAKAIRDAVPSVRDIIVLGDAHADAIDLRGLCALPADHEDPAATLDALPISPDAVALFLLSGGTTGLPKLIPRSHNDYRYNAEVANEAARFDDSTNYLVTLPASHNFPLACPGLLGTFLAGGTVVMLQSPEPSRAFATIEAQRVTHVAAVPAVVQRWIDYEEAERTGQLATLRVVQVGGSRLVDELAARVKPVLGATLQQVFGMAEGLLNMTRLDDPEPIVIGTQGRPVSPGDMVRIVDEDGDPVPLGGRGVLHTQGPYTLRGYYKAADHNKRSFAPDGWYITGDIVELREDGNLVVQGRDKDLINRAGEKISGEEVENLLYRHPGIEMNAAVAIPDPALGERVCVYATLREGVQIELDDLRRLMRDAGVAAYKLPEVLVIIDSMPLTKVGKIDKKALREDLTRRGALEPGSTHYPG